MGGLNLLNRYPGGQTAVAVTPDPDRFSLWQWFFHHQDRNYTEEVFSYNGRHGQLKDFMSLQFDSAVRMPVVECWTCVLNELEKGRKTVAPSRVFVTIYTLLSSVIFSTGDWDVRLGWFTERLDKVFERAPHINCATVDLFFFPILKAAHYYVLCVNMRMRRFEIIDNSPVVGRNEDRYGAIPQELLDMLSAYLHNKGQGLRSAFVDNMRAIRMQMPWRDSKHREDCGVYTMRHMEAYMGKKCKDWECGLQKGDRNELHKLCQRYLHDILLSKINGHREAIAIRTRTYIRGKKWWRH